MSKTNGSIGAVITLLLNAFEQSGIIHHMQGLYYIAADFLVENTQISCHRFSKTGIQKQQFLEHNVSRTTNKVRYSLRPCHGLQ